MEDEFFIILHENYIVKYAKEISMMANYNVKSFKDSNREFFVKSSTHFKMFFFDLLRIRPNPVTQPSLSSDDLRKDFSPVLRTNTNVNLVKRRASMRRLILVCGCR